MSKTLILTMAFGACKYPKICWTNRELAQETINSIIELKVAAFVERDVACEMKGARSVSMKTQGIVHAYGGNGREYLPGLRIIKAFKIWQESNHKEMEVILFITALPYESRCKRDLEIIFPGILIVTPSFDVEKDFWFNKNSTQWWTRSKRAWKFREKLISLLPWKVYEWLSMR